MLARAPRNNPGGGCGVCSSPESAGKKAHAFLQGLAAQATSLKCTGELGLGTGGVIERRVDIVCPRGDSWHVDIGEIKPNNQDGEKAGRDILNVYETWIKTNRPGIEVGRMLEWPASSTMPFIDFKAPQCPQVLTVINAGDGLFLYDCEPKNDVLENDPACKCGRSQRKQKVNWQGVAVALAIAAAFAAAAKKTRDKLIEVAVQRAAQSLMKEAMEQAAEQAAKQAAKKVAAAIAYIELAAAFILFFVSDAHAEVGPGDSALQTLAQTMDRNGAPLPDELKALIENDPALKAQIEQGLVDHDTSDKRAELNGRMIGLLEAHASEFSKDELRRILALTHATGDATGSELTVERLHEIATLRSKHEGGDGAVPNRGQSGSGAGTDEEGMPSFGGPLQGGGGSSEIPEGDSSDWAEADDGTSEQGGGEAGSEGKAGDGATGKAAGTPGAGGGTPGGAGGTPGAGGGVQGATGDSQGVPGAGNAEQQAPAGGEAGKPGGEGGTTADQGQGGATGPGTGPGGPSAVPGGTSELDGTAGPEADGGAGPGPGPGGPDASTGNKTGPDSSFTTSDGVAKAGGKTPPADAKSQAALETTEQSKFGDIPVDTTYLMVPQGTKLQSGKSISVFLMGRDASDTLFIGRGSMKASQGPDGWSVAMPAGIALFSSGGRYGATKKLTFPVTNQALFPDA